MSTAPFKIYNASAGAGKTYNLVRNYLTICLGAVGPEKCREILAITFTNKAANEMKNRILDALSDMSRYPETDRFGGMLDDLSLELGISKEDLGQRAKNTLSYILHHYSTFSVSTIDKFVNRLIRSFANDLRLNSTYEVELDTDLILGEAIDRFLGSVKSGTDVARVLIRFIETQLEDGKSPRPDISLHAMGHELFRERAFGYLEQLSELTTPDILEIRKQLIERNKDWQDELLKSAEALLDLIDQRGIEHQMFSGQDVPRYLKKLQSGKMELPGKRLRAQISADSAFYAKKNEKIAGPLIGPIEDQLRNALKEIEGFLETIYPLYHLSRLALREIHALAVFGEIERNLEELKEETNRLPIGEFNKIISTNLREQPAAFIYERLGERYKHYFIDEFQDTSLLQWNNMLPLINNAMAEKGTAMIVGDGKQSIYRWRGGDVNQFLGIYSDADASNKVESGGAIHKLYERQSIDLGDNYRSRKEVVNFNNDFFLRASEKLPQGVYREMYGQAPQNVKASDGGYVSLKLLEYEKGYEQRQCEEGLGIVADALERGFAMKDIAILVRRKSEGIRITEFLLENDIRVISSESLLLVKSSAVKALISYVRMTLFKHEPVYRMEFLEYFWDHFARSEERHGFMRKYSFCDMDALYAMLDEHLPDFYARAIESYSLLDKLYYLAHRLKMDIEGDAFLQALVDEAHKIARRDNTDQLRFLEWWDEFGIEKSISIPENLDAVRVMTIHQSKGLEFPVTILAFADWKAFSEQSNMDWFDLRQIDMEGLPVARLNLNDPKDEPVFPFYSERYHQKKQETMLDNLNLLYVAQTRAVDELYILGCHGRQDDQRVTYYFMDFLQEKGVEGMEWSIGEPIEVTTKETPKEVLELPHFQTAPWQKKLKISSDVPEEWNEATRGLLIHDILSRVEYMADLDRVLDQAVGDESLSQQERDDLYEILIRLLQKDELKPYFSSEAENIMEAEIMAPDGRLYRPDRLSIVNGEMCIIDYKTGVPREEHSLQIEGYAQLLAGMGYKISEKLLVYLNEEPELIRC